MSHTLTIVSTADGSNTIYNAEIGENYHSRNGALQESQHVFVNAGIQYFLERSKAEIVSVLEVGFGTGLNFLLSADYCIENTIKLNYTGIEAYPLTAEMISETGYNNYILPQLWEQFLDSYQLSFQSSTELSSFCRLQTAHCQLLKFKSPIKYDVIYFDAFAAAHQPEMWNEEAIAHTIQFLKPGGVFVTYAITGNLKRMLKGWGLAIQKIPGAAGKREMLRAVR